MVERGELDGRRRSLHYGDRVRDEKVSKAIFPAPLLNLGEG